MVFEEVFSREECEEIAALAYSLDAEKVVRSESFHAKDWKLIGFGKGEKRHHLADRFRGVMEKQQPWFNEVGGFENFHVYEYIGLPDPDKTGHLVWHVDLKEDNLKLLTFIVQLSPGENYTGGELVVGEHSVSQKQGSIILFPGWMLHQVTALKSGSRWVMAGWFQPPDGKTAKGYLKHAVPHYEQMVKYSEKLPDTEENPNTLIIETLVVLANTCEYLKLWPRAERCLKRLNRWRPGDSMVLSRLSQSIVQQNKPERYGDALRYLEEILRNDPDHKYALALSKQVKQHMGRSAGEL